MKHLNMLLAALLWMSLAPTAGATGLPTILSRSGLTPQDIEIMSVTAARLYEASSPKVGDSSDWQNTQSGASGRVEIAQIEGNCVVLLHRFKLRTSSDVQPIQFTRCKLADGTWQLN